MQKTESGGQAGYVGYEYQILVSVWVALELMLAKKMASEIEIEPATDEDIAANLEVVDPSSTMKVPVGRINLQVQIKHRSSHWTQTAFKDVVNGKPPAQPKKETNTADKATDKKSKNKGTPRLRALAILEANLSAQYVMISDTTVDAALRPFKVDSLLERSGATTLPWAKPYSVPANVPPRLAILSGRTRELLDLAIDKILGEHANVPAQKREDCREALAATVRLRLLNKLPGKWTLEELQGTIEQNGGYWDPGPSLVLPDNFAIFEETLNRFHAVLITGSAGTGKTTVANELVRRRKSGPDSAAFVHSSQGLGAVKQALDRQGRCVFYIEDPWGKYERDSDTALWIKVLPDLIAQANPSKQFIITTRRSVQQTEMKKLPPALARVEHELLPEHYSRDARRLIFAQSLRGAAPWQRDWASRHLHEILNGLAAPLALDSCARLIKQAAVENGLSVENLVKRCNVEVLADTFAQEIIGRKGDAIEAVLALWAWQTSERAVSEAAAGTLRNTLAAGGLTPVPDVRKLHQWLGSSGWWESAPEGLVAHPTVLAGAESLAKEEPEVAERVFGALLLGLVTSGDPGRALTIRQQVQKHLSSIANDVERAVARFAVESLLTTPETEWQQAFYRAQALDLKGSPVATLLVSLRSSSDGFLERWNAPVLSPEEISAIQASPEAREVARRWVLTVLPHAESYDYDGGEVARFLQRFGFDFSDELFAVAAEELEKGYGSRSVGIVVEAALSGPKPRYEEMLNLALASREDAELFVASNKEALRKADQEEIDEVSYESLNYDLISAFAASDDALHSIVASRRQREGWRWLLEEGRPGILRRFWTVVIKADSTVEELAAIEQAFRGAEREYYWQAVANAQRHDLVPQLLSEFSQIEGEQLEKCITHVSKLIAPEDWSRVIPAAVAQLEWPRRATLTRFRRPPMPGGEFPEWMPGAFSVNERAALALCDAAVQGNLGRPTASRETRLLLRELAAKAEPHLAGLALVPLASLKEDITSLLPRLEGSGERAAQLAALVAQHLANSPDLPRKLQAALGAPHYHIRAAAVDMLAPTVDETSKAAILRMAVKDPSAPVRRVCAAVIAREQWPEGEDVLVALLDDRHDYGTPNDEGPDFRVAHAAAEGLRSKPVLKRSTVERIYAILTEKNQRQDDVRVHYTLIFCLAAQEDDRIVPLLVQSLRSPWYVSTYRHSGYPLRYAAGWALWHHLHRRPQGRKLVALRTIRAAAAHDDDRLAAPALLVLGLLQEIGLLQLREVADSSAFTPARALLVAISADDAASRDLLRSAVGDAHPAWAFLNLPRENRPRNREEWQNFLSRQQQFLGWLRTIQSDDGLFPTIRFLLRALLSFDDPEELPPGDPFDQHYPQQPQSLALGTFPIRG